MEKIYTNSFGQRHRDDGLPAYEHGGDGSKEWWVNGKLHRDGDLPAIEWGDGDKSWWVRGKLHREGGLPAVVENRCKQWWVNGKLHHDNDLPATEYANESREWWVNGKLHREGGLPAVELGDYKVWWLNGRELSEEQGLAYFTFCKKIQEKNRIRAQKKIYFWWIQICYDLEHKSGCGQRMAQRNLKVFESMMKI